MNRRAFLKISGLGSFGVALLGIPASSSGTPTYVASNPEVIWGSRFVYKNIEWSDGWRLRIKKIMLHTSWEDKARVAMHCNISYLNLHQSDFDLYFIYPKWTPEGLAKYVRSAIDTGQMHGDGWRMERIVKG